MEQTMNCMDYPLILRQHRPMQSTEKGDGFQGQRIVVLPGEVVTRARRHPLLAGLLPTDVGSFPTAAGHLRRRVAGVDQAIFIYCSSGGGWCELAGTQHAVRAGELLVIPPGTPHAYGADENAPWTIHWLHVSGNNVPATLEELGTTATRPVLYLGEDSRLLGLFDEVLEAIEPGYTPARLLYAAHALAHLLGTMIWLRHENFRGEPDLHQKITRSIAYMKQHLGKPLRTAYLASQANLSSSHYGALFKQQTGYSPIDYFIRLRMHQACQLLDTTSFSIKEIATRLGYQDPFYFSRAFRSVNKVAPTEYRRLHKG